MALPKNALISVSNKEGLEVFAGGIHELGVNIFSSGGTATAIREAGIPAIDVADIVGPPLLGDRVKTLSRQLHAGMLAIRRNDMHVEELERQSIPWLGLVCVDMYPLAQTIASGADEATVTEGTDVGGPTMLHSATKGRRIVLSRGEQRPVVLEWLQSGMPDEENVLRTLAAVAEQEAKSYLELSANYIGDLVLQSAPRSSYDFTLRQPLLA